MKVLVLGSNGQLGHSLKKQSTHSKKDFIFSNKKMQYKQFIWI